MTAAAEKIVKDFMTEQEIRRTMIEGRLADLNISGAVAAARWFDFDRPEKGVKTDGRTENEHQG